MYQTVSMQIPKLSSVCTERQFSGWLNDQKEHFGTVKAKQFKNVTKRGRYLYAMKETVHGKNNWFFALFDSLIKTFLLGIFNTNDHFKSYIKSAKGTWINVGYIRKSPSDESEETRDRLLDVMAAKIIKKWYCIRVYVSSCLRANEPILKRDYQNENKGYYDGNTQGKNHYAEQQMKCSILTLLLSCQTYFDYFESVLKRYDFVSLTMQD